MRIPSPLIGLFLLVAVCGPATADPCGMVPPIYTGDGPALTRIGVQETYVFYKDGYESIALRPGFSGSVEEFGMLIPFPTPPAIRKVPDQLFAHLAAAVDPPVLIGVVLPPGRFNEAYEPSLETSLGINEVRVLRQEAIGMYEVVVLEAGSSNALNVWMDDNGFVYPDGMDAPVQDYVEAGWCFVAVRTRVAPDADAAPQPGMRDADPRLPEGATFDGNVQAMAFRFRTDQLVVPMRLSAFNAGELNNIVYCLAEEPLRIDRISETLVTHQIPGAELLRNVTAPLTVRISGRPQDMLDLERVRQELDSVNRDPTSRNGHARDLFAGDLLAVRLEQLSLDREESEKELLEIAERLGLRGELDTLHVEALREVYQATLLEALEDLRGMTLTVIEGDFPREVLASANLTFSPYTKPPQPTDSRQPSPYVPSILVHGAGLEDAVYSGLEPPEEDGDKASEDDDTSAQEAPAEDAAVEEAASPEPAIEPEPSSGCGLAPQTGTSVPIALFLLVILLGAARRQGFGRLVSVDRASRGESGLR
jgi:Uncharacterized protein conserved in bacteria (DUF2330)